MSPVSAAPEIEPAALVDYYLPAAGVYDEMRTPEGEVRPHWRYLLDALHTLGLAGIEERRREASRLLRDNGVSYNLHGDPQGVSRPWDLDLLPLLIRSNDWAELERGLMQRAELLNLILLDLYGPRELIRNGSVPADLFDAYPGYLLPCHGVPAAGDRPLVHYAADLTRTPDGGWLVIADRSESPAGAGYSLENRVVLSRVIPSLFRDSHVHRVAGFFRSMRRTLTRLAPRRAAHSQVVVLTPGPRSQTYFEHAYLANYLGYTLVQGADLSVRDGALWLRTLGRLERIDAVLRRVGDAWCDPLELREDSLLGVPGLVQAVRFGNVTLANALGSGILEHPGLAVFLPDLCQKLLGEDLLLPGPAAWWCGNPEHLKRVLEDLEGLVVKSTQGDEAGRPIFGAEMEAGERAVLAARIRAEPRRFVAQELVVPSTSPVLVGSLIEPHPTVLRSFLVSEEEGYAVLPGGLTRVALSRDMPVVSNQLGGLGKDTWVLASEPERQETLTLPSDHLAPAVFQESQVSSRVADNLFWIGRYAERGEGLVRLLRAVIFKLAERASFSPGDEVPSSIRSLLEALTRQTLTFPGFVGQGAEERLSDPIPEMLSLISDPKRLGALPQTLQALGQAAWSVRDRMSADTWRVVNDTELRLLALTKRPPSELAAALDELDPLITSLVAFSAVTQENMTHDEGWHFLEAGRRLERGANLATLLRATLVPVTGETEENLVVEAVLGVTDSIITYRRRYQAGTRVGALLDLVYQNEANPRALAYQLVKLERLVAEMPRTELQTGRTVAEKLVLKALTNIRLAEIDRLVSADPQENRRLVLDAVLEEVELDLAAISDALTALYFRHEEQPHALLGAGRGGAA